MTIEELKQEIALDKKPKEWRNGQHVFNYIDEIYGVARHVQFVDRIDCFYDDTQIDAFIAKSVERINNLLNWKPFEGNPDNVPDLPTTSLQMWNDYYVPLIIKCGGIPKKDLVIGATYIGSCRNSTEATWNGSYFVYDRHKFGSIYEDHINHFEDDNGYDLFVPLKIKQK